ncbi:MAG: hypothetical protein ACR2H4_20910 [Pyrinomonadaceae bacterium]
MTRFRLTIAVFAVLIGISFAFAQTKKTKTGLQGHAVHIATTADELKWGPANMSHFAFASGETILQIHGTGPFAITYVNPADDPRKKQ